TYAVSIDLEQTGAALATADAHGHHAPLGLAPAALLQDVAGEPRAGHAERMTDRDRAAIDVVLGRIDAEPVATVEALAGEGLVQFPDVDVVDLQALALEKLRHGEHRADAHLVGLAARDRPRHEAAHRLEPALLGILGFHQHHRGGAVGELARVAGGDVFTRDLHRLELGEAFHRRVGTVALIARDDVVDDALRLRRLVDDLHPGLHRDDLVLELVGLLCGGHAALRLQRILVLIVAAELVALGDDVGGIDHRHVDVGRVFQKLGVLRLLRDAADRRRNAFDAAGDDAVGAVGTDAVRRHRNGLQARRAEAVDGDAGRRLRHAGEQRRLAADVAGAMGAIAEITILDIILVDAGALHRMLDGVRRHGHRRGDVESAAGGFCEPGARIGNDDGFTHASLPFRLAAGGVALQFRRSEYDGRHVPGKSGNVTTVIPGRCGASNYGAQLRTWESRDSGSGADAPSRK